MADLEGVRKLEAILAADVAGYSRLMQEDDEATVAMLEAYRAVFREKIQARRGRVVDMAGDSVLAVFEAATEAVLAARNETLPEARRMRFRIGVNLGEVIERPDGTVYGDGVNIAARLQSIGEPGGVTVSGTVFDHVKNRVEVGFDFIGEQEVKNITELVRAYRVVAEGTPVSTLVQRKRQRAISQPVLIGGAAAAAVLIATAGIYSYRHVGPTATALSLPDKPSIAVLPFVNMSGDTEQEYFSDGMTEDVITSLSKRSDLFVIARNSVFTYKGHAVKPEQVSHELGVRYVLEGSVRKVDKRVRITAQLIDATTGYHLWAEHYDGELNDIFALQDSVTQKIVNALSPKLSSEGSSTLAHRQTTNVDAHDLFLRGLAIKLKPQKETNPEARRLFQAAIELDPNYALAYSWLAITYADEWTYLWTKDSGALARGIDIARKAVALDGSLAEARRALGYILVLDKQYEPGLPELEKAVSLDPNSSVAYGTLANALNLLGRPEEAIGFVKKAMRVDPKSGPWVACWLGDSYYWLHRYDEAVAAYQDAVRRNPNYLTARRNLAATYAEMGRERDAKAEAAEVLRLNPSFSVELFRSRIAIKSEADLNRLVTALQKAGLK
jgi:adenylate cyclase